MESNQNNSPPQILLVGPDDDGTRLDVFCASRLPSLSRNQIQKLNEDGRVTVDSVVRSDSYHLKAGERIAVLGPAGEPVDRAPQPQHIPLRIVHEDGDIIVLNKDAGIVVHPAHGHWEGTLVNAVLGHGSTLASLGGVQRPGIVHRLDKDTSGLLVLAKTDTAYRSLREQLDAHEVTKIYHAIVWGNLDLPERRIDAPISRHPVHRQKMAVAKRGGREAITDVFVVDSFNHFDYIRIATVTGRTHQIRVHLSHITHPVLGDSVYGGRRKKGISSSARVSARISSLLKIMQRHALHASSLSFHHPLSGQRLEFKTSLPDDMTLTLEALYREDSIKEA